MIHALLAFVYVFAYAFRHRQSLALENLALRQQLAVYQRRHPRPQLRLRDRLFWVWLSKVWSQWRSALSVVKPETVLIWHREGFKLFWTRLSRRKAGRPKVNAQVKALIKQMTQANPSTAAWTAQQIIETFPDETAPRFLLRDRDQIYSGEFRLRVAGMKIEEVITAARSPWQNAYMERLIGSIRRECLDYVIVLGENHLRRILRSYFAYYHSSRTHLSLCKDAPELRAKQAPECGPVIEIAEVGGLHHRYERRAA